MNQKEERWIEFEACQIDDEENEPNFDIFGDPDPYEIFGFKFDVQNWTVKDNVDDGDEDNNNNNDAKNENVATDGVEKDKQDPNKMSTTKEISIQLKGYKHEHERIFDSTGLTLWRASKLLCQFMCTNYTKIRNKSVIELGSGLGLCGLLAYHLGARNVVMTDGDTDVLTEMRLNVDANLKSEDVKKRDSSSSSSSSSSSPMSSKPSQEILPCHQLRWGKEYTKKFKQEIIQSIQQQEQSTKKNKSITNNTNFNEQNKVQEMDGFDVIIASDVIYVEYVLDDLFDTILELLSSSTDSKAYIGYARRAVDISIVFECAERHGLQWMEPDDGVVEGVYVFSRKKK